MHENDFFNEDLLCALAGVAGEDNVLMSEPMREHTTFKIGGPADVFVTPDTEQGLVATLDTCYRCDLPLTIVGNGSDLLVGDKGIRGVVVALGEGLSDITVDGTHVTAAAGALLSDVAAAAAEADLTGMEPISGIPGSVGGACYMNAGAYGGEMKDVLASVRYLTGEGEIVEAPAEQLDLRYRHSIFEENGGCILSAQFALQPGNAADIRAKMEELMAKRVDKQPLDKPSAGSTFKRPAGAFAAALIDQCGLRGFRHGGAAVSDKHCGFVVNLGGATCADVLALCDEVRAIVKEKTGNDPLEMFEKAMENIMPNLECKTRRVGGANYQVPLEVSPARRETLGLRWLTAYSRARGEKTMSARLAAEIIDATNGVGGSVKKREDTHKMAEANKAFAHYRY